ncbi:lysoplasmalogenase [Rhodococcus sp. HNM0569]|uniref:lysoplasmalogenase n=1 Tax=Rhodococcus sp. HNM0569 TaxID=2716340 RepID=UPI001469F1A1|nr:lysoplasmalogenase [Rhodococcus sp. HNM0569]NLU83229.1 lysoplasmalogenase [Rhodococcus sp. HNM0569]
MAGKWIERAVFAAAAATTVVGGVTGRETLQRVAKPLIAPSLGVMVWRRRRGTEPVDTALLATGLAAATVGDVFMIDPDDDARIVRGAAAFAVMQACYSALLVRHGAKPTTAAVVPRAAGWAVAATGLWARSRPVAAPLSAYGLTLGTTGALSGDPALTPGTNVVAGVPVPGDDPRSRLGAGGLLFTLSDGLIVVRRLVLNGRRRRAVAEGAVLATYSAAQLLLVEGMLALGRSRALRD